MVRTTAMLLLLAAALGRAETNDCAAVAAPVVAPSFTNHAGHAISARPIQLTETQVVFETGTNTPPRTLPRSVFPDSEIARIRTALGLSPEPSPETALRRAHYEDQLRRIDALERDGILSPESAASRRAAIRAHVERLSD